MYHGGVYATVADIQALPVSAAPSLAYCLANGLTYAYHPAPATSFGVLPAANGVDFLSTANGGDTRWISYSYDGTYTPTLAGTINITGTPTADVCQYTRVGRNITGSFWAASVDPTVAATASAFTMTLPYTASANFSGNTEAGGYAWNINWGANTGAAWSPGTVRATAGAKLLTIDFQPDDGTARPMNIIFHFRLL